MQLNGKEIPLTGQMVQHWLVEMETWITLAARDFGTTTPTHAFYTSPAPSRPRHQAISPVHH
eukprot:scaffold37312_cov30-Tisochrysis_lutea.AAC.1